MSLIFGRQVFETLAQLASAVITQITLNQTDYNTLHSMVQAATAAAQAAHPGATLFYVTFSDDPYGTQGGWVRQICVCHNTAAVTTHWDAAVEFPMIASNGSYYADLSGAKTVQNVTGSSIGTFTPSAPPSDGTSGGSSAVSLTTVYTSLNGDAAGFGTLSGLDSLDHYWTDFMTANNWPMTRRFFWMLAETPYIYYNSGSDSYPLQTGQTQASLIAQVGSAAVQVDGMWDITDQYASDNSSNIQDH